MNDFAQFIGFFTAHMVWQLEGGENVIPLIASQKAGMPCFDRVSHDTSYEHAVAIARERLQVLLPNNDYALLAYDGFLTWDNERLDSLFIEAIEAQNSEEIAFHLAIPYQSANQNSSLIIYQPKVLKITASDRNAFIEKFYEGVNSHIQASEFWTAHMKC